MRILGVDPGLQITGYGVVAIGDNFPSAGQMDLIEAGVIRSKASSGIAARLSKIHDSLSELILELSPDVLVIEKLYAHYKHPATAILMGHVRGVVCLLSGIKNIPLVNIASTHVKKSVTGHGHASKRQMQGMVQHYLKLSRTPEPPDVADALAIAISYAFTLRNDNGAAQRELSLAGRDEAERHGTLFSTPRGRILERSVSSAGKRKRPKRDNSRWAAA